MKIHRKIVQVFAIVGVGVCLVFTALDVKDALTCYRDYSVPLAFFAICLLLGLAFLVYRDRVSKKIRLHHAYLLYCLISVVLTVLSMWSVIWFVRIYRTDPQGFAHSPKALLMIVGFPLGFLLTSVSLWIEAWSMQKKI